MLAPLMLVTLVVGSLYSRKTTIIKLKKLWGWEEPILWLFLNNEEVLLTMEG